MTTDARPKLYYGWIILGVCVLANLIIQGIRYSSGLFLKPMSVELDWSRALVSQGFALSNLMIGIYQPFTGRLVDRWGGRKTMALGAFLAALLTVILGFTKTPWHFFVVFGVIYPFGVGASTLGSASAVLQRWFRRRRGTVLAIATAGASAGQFLVAPAFGIVLINYGWRSTLIAAGVITAVVMVPLLAIFIRERPQDMGLQPDGAAAPPPTAHGNPAQAVAFMPPLECTLKEASRTLPFWLLCGGFFVCGWTVGIINAHIAAFLDDVGFSRQFGAYVLSIIGGMNLLGTLTVGGVSDRIGRKALPLAVVYFIRGLGLMMLVLSQSYAAVVAFSFLVGMAWLATVPMTYGLAGDHYGMRSIGSITGIIFLSHQVGAAISISLAGWWAETYGSYVGFFFISAILCFAAAVCSYIIKERPAFAAPQPAEA